MNIHSGQADQKRVIDFYGKDVLPPASNRFSSPARDVTAYDNEDIDIGIIDYVRQ